MREVLILVLAAAAVFTWLAWPDPEPPAPASRVAGLLGGPVEGLPRIREPRPLVWPRDHGAHPAYRHEWWYFTGHLEAAGGRSFGFQFTLFRFRMPGGTRVDSAWATDQVWMAHLALSDHQRQRFLTAERLARGAVGLAGASPGRWWLRDWRVVDNGAGWTLRASTGEFGLELDLEPSGPPVLQGEAGYSRKGPEPGNASMYYSQPRLAAGGELRIGDTRLAVKGEAWLDREWGTSALGPDLAGWDWFALQLADGASLMIYRLRTRQGGTARWSAGKWVGADGRTRTLSASDFRLAPLESWRDGAGHDWPVAWRLRVPAAELDVRVEAVFPGQLWTGRVHYWEGAVDVRRHDNGAEAGRGYLEMTGYADAQ